LNHKVTNEKKKSIYPKKTQEQNNGLNLEGDLLERHYNGTKGLFNNSAKH
jgi:hypothetical protein